MFEEDYEYFPSLREIRDGLIKAQIRDLDSKKDYWNDKTKFNHLKKRYTK